MDDVAHALERERMMFVDQQAGDSDYSDCDEDGRNNGLAARVAREALFMESVALFHARSKQVFHGR